MDSRHFVSSRALRIGAICLLFGGAVLVDAREHARLLRVERNFHELLLDPLGLERLSRSELPKEPGVLRIVLLGDSRIVDWPAPGVAGAEVVNRGVGGQTSAQVLERYERQVAALRPDVIVLQLGINDLVSASHFPGARRWLEERCAARIHALVARASGAGSVVVLTTVFPPGLPPSFPEREPEGLVEAVAHLNARLQQLASPSVIVLDAASVLTGAEGRVRESYARDPLHLTPAGYAALNARLRPLLDSLVAHRRALEDAQ